MRYDEDNAVAVLANVAFDRVERLTGQNNKLKQQNAAYGDLPDTLASARALLTYIAENIGNVPNDAIVSSINLELRKG